MMKKILILIIGIIGMFSRVRADNVLSASVVSGHPGDTVEMHLSLSNTDDVVAFQTTIPLYGELTYVPNSCRLTARGVNHVVTAAVVNDSLRIISYSLGLQPYSGNSGDIIIFNLLLEDEPATYPITLNKSIIANASGQALPYTFNNGSVTLLSPKIRLDNPVIDFGHCPIRSIYRKSVNVTNVGNESLIITALHFSDSAFYVENFIATTVTAGNSISFSINYAPVVPGNVNETLTIVSNSITGTQNVRLIASPYSVNEFHVGNATGISDSIVDIDLSVNNMDPIVAFQSKIKLPSALEYIDESFQLSSRKSNHLAFSGMSGDTLILLAYSPDNSTFLGEEGTIATFQVKLIGTHGYYYLTPRNVILADANGNNVLSDSYSGYVQIKSPRIYCINDFDMGSTSVTEPVTKPFTISNSGDAPLTIENIIFNQTNFSIQENLPLTVASWESTVINITYNGTAEGNFSSNMRIYSNDPVNGLVNVTVHGQRYEPNEMAFSIPEKFYYEDIPVAMELNNYSEITAAQFDFHFPNDYYTLQSSDFQLSNRCGDHIIYAVAFNDSTWRVLIFSMNNQLITGNSGTLVTATLHPKDSILAGTYQVSLTNIVLSDIAGVNKASKTDTTQSFTTREPFITQTNTLQTGWNWFSTYIEAGNGAEMLAKIESELGTNGLDIISQSDFVQYVSGNWYGTLTSVVNEKSYMIKMSASKEMALTGPAADPANHPITLDQGWTWIGFVSSKDLSVSQAFSNITPENGDIIQSLEYYATYYSGTWVGSLNTMHAGEGFMYKAATAKTLIYPSSPKESLTENVTTDGNYWQLDTHKYANNGNITASIIINDTEQNSDIFEVGAFVDGECRGSARPIFVEPLNRYLIFLTVHGESGDEISFKLYDSQTGEILESSQTVIFEPNIVMGSPDEPYELHFNTITTVEENDDGNLTFFPNPVNKNENLKIDYNFTGEEQKNLIIEIYNITGAMLQRIEPKRFPLTIDGLNVSGLYYVKIITETGKILNGKIIVR